MKTPTKDSLLAFLITLVHVPDNLIQEINENYDKTIGKWMARTEAQWKDIAGISNGIDIYNYLHPAPHQLIVSGVERPAEYIEWKTKTLQKLDYNPKSNLFELDTDYLDASGLPVSRKLVLYCHLGWILGPPGTGKSTTALAFASSIDSKEWTVTWIHLSRWERPICVRYEGCVKKTCEIDIRDPMLTDLDNILFDVDSSSNHLLFVDGYTLNGHRHIDVGITCHSWLKENRNTRRLVFVCSMSSRGRSNLEEDQGNKVKVHFVYSWTIDQYLAAVQYNNFLENVNDKLDAGDEVNSDLTAQKAKVAQPSRKDLIESKFYFAGGCARFMFLFNTSTVINFLEESVDYVPDIMPYITGSIGYTSEAVVNRLFSVHLQEDKKKISIVSEWAASQLAIKGGPKLAMNIAQVLRRANNPVMDGWMLEMWFFALVESDTGVELCDKDGNRTGQWPKALVKVFSDTIPALPGNGRVWLKPSKWNQGGYDAIFVDKNSNLVRFVQVTRGDSHSFKIEYFYQFLVMLSESASSFEIMKLEIVFLLLAEKLYGFKITKVTGEGLLVPYGWEKGKEVENVQVKAIKGWNK